jgi:hypothetical protein
LSTRSFSFSCNGWLSSVPWCVDGRSFLSGGIWLCGMDGMGGINFKPNKVSCSRHVGQPWGCGASWTGWVRSASDMAMWNNRNDNCKAEIDLAPQRLAVLEPKTMVQEQEREAWTVTKLSQCVAQQHGQSNYNTSIPQQSVWHMHSPRDMSCQNPFTS